jgi:protein-L-isoaspartate(D-aspartate) O-methyltransferase
MLANDVETARFNMIVQQIRPWEVIDERVLGLYGAVPREHYVSDEYQGLAFADIAVPIGEDQFMMKPVQEARMLQALDVQPGESVLEVGTGSGFITACLSHLGGIVTSYEIRAQLSEAASERLRAEQVENVELVVGDGLHAGLAPGSFQVIALTGSVPSYPDYLEGLLAPGGRMFAVVGEGSVMTAMLIQRDSNGEIWKESLFETLLPTLDAAPELDHFVF